MNCNDSAPFTRLHDKFISPRLDDHPNRLVFAEDIESRSNCHGSPNGFLAQQVSAKLVGLVEPARGTAARVKNDACSIPLAADRVKF